MCYTILALIGMSLQLINLIWFIWLSKKYRKTNDELLKLLIQYYEKDYTKETKE